MVYSTIKNSVFIHGDASCSHDCTAVYVPPSIQATDILRLPVGVASSPTLVFHSFSFVIVRASQVLWHTSPERDSCISLIHNAFCSEIPGIESNPSVQPLRGLVYITTRWLKQFFSDDLDAGGLPLLLLLLLLPS